MLEPILAGDGSLHYRDPLITLALRFGLKDIGDPILKQDLNAELAPKLMAWDRGGVPAIGGKVQHLGWVPVLLHILEGEDVSLGDNGPARPPHPKKLRLFRQVTLLQNS